MSYDSNANYDCPKYVGVMQTLLYTVFQRQEPYSELNGCWALSALQLQYAALPVASSIIRQDSVVRELWPAHTLVG